MLLLEQELTVEVTQIDGVQVNDLDVAKAGEDEIFEQLTTNTTCAYDEDFGGVDPLESIATDDALRDRVACG